MVVVLPEPLTPTTRITNGFCAASISKRFCDRRQHLLHFGRDNGFHVVGRNRLVVAAVADRRRYPRRHFGAEIGAQQHVLDILEHGAVELAFCHQVGDRRPQRTRGALEAAGQPPPPAQFGLFRGVVHVGGVLAVSRHERKSQRTRRNPGLTAEEIQARVLHRDGLMLVIDKPAGLPVHRGPKGGANLEASFDALRFGLPRPPVLAHRLDRDTSGCLVLGRHRKATASLGLLFKHGKISKTYWAVVEGGPAEDEGSIDLPLGRLNAERGWWQKPDPEGQTAVYQLEGAGPRRRSRLAGDGTRHRPHPSIARACRRDGLADRRRQHLWQRSKIRRADACICIPARSGFRFRRTRSRCAWLRRRRRICRSGSGRAGGTGSSTPLVIAGAGPGHPASFSPRTAKTGCSGRTCSGQ